MASSTVLASTALTATGNTAGFPLGPITTGVFAVFVNVTAVSGTLPTMDLAVEFSFDNTTFYPLQGAFTFTQITAVSKAVKQANAVAPYFRVAYTIGGTTPSFTTQISVSYYPSNRIPSIEAI